MFALEGKVAAITGGGGALCGAMAVALGSMGVKVAILDKQLDNAKKKEKTITDSGGSAMALTCDVLRPDHLKQCYEVISNAWGTVDFLINGAGGNHPQGTTSTAFFERKAPPDPDAASIFDLDPAQYRKVFDVNYMGTFLTTQIFSRGMVEKGSGSIVNISSMSAGTPLTKVVAYSSAKAAVSNFTRWLAVYFAKAGVRVNALAPGFFMTEQLRFLHVDQKTGQLTPRAQQVIANTPMGRYGEPADLIGPLVWLLSDASRFVTGVIVPIDGGFSAYSI
ncbi:MAG: D-mannonate oxidoreductase [Deltaproteobacteria bacterium SG8_13]|nr:MAG: D-mannonate oxidoreductase [Deltaproteobacteria bacterium SG8_13]